MKNATVNVQIQFDVYGDNPEEIKEEVINALSEMSRTIGNIHADRAPLIFTNSIDSSDIYIDSDEEEE
jgi:SHS2 domain-containing protein